MSRIEVNRLIEQVNETYKHEKGWSVTTGILAGTFAVIGIGGLVALSFVTAGAASPLLIGAAEATAGGFIGASVDMTAGSVYKGVKAG